ncbi:MAG: HupE/UreJ family protein, partial [Acidobacteriota bacterium]
TAHATGENYVWLNVETDRIEGRFEIRLDDLRQRFGLTIPDVEADARAAIAANADVVQDYLRQHFEIRIADAPLAYDFTGTGVVDAPGLGWFAQYHYRTVDATIPDQIDVRNSVLLDGDDRFHRSLLCIEHDRRTGREYGEEFTALVFAAHTSEQTLDLADVDGLLRVRDFIWQGVLHIWIGIDHVLFLLALLLTAVVTLRRRDDEDASPTLASWHGVDDFRSALWNVVKIVTIFTVAHSITLGLAALGILNLPSRLVESIIALSIVLVALDNLRPRFHGAHWLLLFLFGLFHGMGFASVMGELPFRMMHLVQVILAFNVGVELGQVAIVAVAFPILYALRNWRHYNTVILGGGSVAIGLLALWWFVERAFGL